MAPLCSEYLVNTKKQENPSPKTIHSHLNSPKRKKRIKELSACISLSSFTKGSMTVEAAMLLPLFLFFVLSVGNAMEILRLHSKLELAVWDAGRHIAVYGGAMTSEEMEKTESVPRNILTAGYVKESVQELLGEAYLENSVLEKGTRSLRFGETKMLDNDCFEAVITYQVNPTIGLWKLRPFSLGNRYYGHLWNGYDVGLGSGGETERWVYVAENGKVYHTSRECTHLSLSIREVDSAEARRSVNENGEHYVQCQLCGQNMEGNCVYITDCGDCYHALRTCSGLKRTVRMILWEEATDYRSCHRCT